MADLLEADYELMPTSLRFTPPTYEAFLSPRAQQVIPVLLNSLACCVSCLARVYFFYNICSHLFYLATASVAVFAN